MATVEVRRPRRVVPRTPGGEFALEPPPEPERPVPAGILARLLPLLMLLGSVAFVASAPNRDPSSLLFGGMFALSTVGMLFVGGGGRSAGQRQAALDEQRRDYLRYLAVARRRVRAVAAEQRAALEHVHPIPGGVAGRAGGRPAVGAPRSDPDFGQLRLGRGAQRLATRLVAPQTGPVDDMEPVSALALRRFLRGHAVVADLPVALSLRGSSAVWLEPEPGVDTEAARALARALLAQYVAVARPGRRAAGRRRTALPGPGVGVGQVAPARRAPAPVRRHRAAADGHRRRRRRPPLVGARAGRTASRAPEPASRTCSWSSTTRPGPVRGRRWPAPPCSAWVPHPGVGRRPSVVRLSVGRDGPGSGGPRRHGHRDRAAGRADGGRRRRRSRGASRATAPRARRGRRRRSAQLRRPPSASRPAAAPVRVAAVAALRERRATRDRLRVPIGVDETGAPVALDIKESAQGGSGPHGLCIGATGSGKSELLRTLVLGLAATHSSAELNLVLVDFKGGATFLGLAGLPHVAAVITNLADELTLVDRMADALAGEITRRQELLRAAGNLTGVAEYAAARGPRRAAAAAAGAAGRRRRVLRAARPRARARRPARHDRAAGPLAGPAPAAGLAAARRGPAARPGVAPVVPDRAAHVLRRRVAGRARGPRRAPAAARARLGLPGHGHG